MPTTLYREPQRPIEWRQLVLAKTPRLPFPKAHPGYADPIIDFVVERHGVTPKMQPRGKRLQAFSRPVVDELAGFEADPGGEKSLPARKFFELTANSESYLLRREPR
jgi:hypothetical protein